MEEQPISEEDRQMSPIDLSNQNPGAKNKKEALSWLKNSSQSFLKRGIIPAETFLFKEWLESKGGKTFLPQNGVYLEDFGCGTGIKAGLIAAALQEHVPVNAYTLIDSQQITTKWAEKQVRRLAKKPGLFRRQKINKIVDNFIDPSIQLPKEEGKLVRLCLGNIVDNFEPEVIYPALARELNSDDLLVVGLLREDFKLPAELSNQTVRDDSPELSQYPQEFQDAIKSRGDFGRNYHQEEICGIDKNHYDFHVSFDPKRKRWFHMIVPKGINEENNPDLYSKGYRNGREILIGFARVQTEEEHKRDLEKYFTIVDTLPATEDAENPQTIFILQKPAGNF